jgi:hypothetical protein
MRMVTAGFVFFKPCLSSRALAANSASASGVDSGPLEKKHGMRYI